MQKYDIFISYRRQGGEAIARDLCERFTDMGYKVFFDVESLRSGDFDKTLYNVVEHCDDFLIILSPGALDRCENDGDWVRNELAYALIHEKNVVPVMLRGFDFPQTLPDDIAAVRNKSGIEVSTQLFDAFVDKLRGFFKSKPSGLRRVIQNRFVRKTLPFFTALVILCIVLTGGYAAYENLRPKTFPHTQVQKNIMNELLGNLSIILFDYNNIVSLEYKALAECSDYLNSDNPVALENALSAIDRSISEISKVDSSKGAISVDLSNKLDNTPVNKSGILMFMSDYISYINEAVNNLRFIKFVINDSVYGTDIKKKIAGLYIQNNELTAKYVVYYSNAVTLDIDGDFLSDFKKSLLPLTALPYDGYVWLDSEEELENQLTINLNKLENIANELASITGDQNIQYVNEIEKFKISLQELGLSREEIDNIIADIVRSSRNTGEAKKNIQEKKESLTSTKETIKSIKDEAQIRFAPAASDDEGTLWGKMLRFLTLDMPDDAINCLEAVNNKIGDSSSDAAFYRAVKNYIHSIGETGVDYGVVVAGFEDNAVHKIYLPGDIIVAVNGRRCLNDDSYTAFNIKPGDSVTILRYENNKPVFTVETFVQNQPKIWFRTLTERDADESAEPFEGLSSDQLWERMTEKISDIVPKEAIDCAQTYHMMVRGEDKNADIYIPAIISFVKNVSETGINYGVVVTAENGDGSDNLITGDIIIKVNGLPCHNSSDYVSFNMDTGSVITVMRKNISGGFDTIDIYIDKQPPITVKNINTGN